MSDIYKLEECFGNFGFFMKFLSIPKFSKFENSIILESILYNKNNPILYIFQF